MSESSSVSIIIKWIDPDLLLNNPHFFLDPDEQNQISYIFLGHNHVGPGVEWDKLMWTKCEDFRP